ncbi:MAG TPA: YcxB family protein [Pyrinomonadaceae bacterium]
MEVEYEITTEDLFAYQWRACYKSPITRRARRKAYIYLLLLLLVLSLVGAFGSGGFSLSLANFAWVAVAFPVLACMIRYSDRRQTRRAIRELLKDEKPDKGQLGVHRIALTETGLVERTAVGESRVTWAGVDRVEQNEEYVFIYTAPSAAHIIPKRAFGSPREAESFYRLAGVSKEAASVATTSTLPGGPS